MTQTYATVADLVRASRTARKLSREKFGELVGLSGTQIHNIEKGRKLKDGEWEKLAPYVSGVPAQESAPAEQPQVPPVEQQPQPAAPVSPPPAEAAMPPHFISNSEVQTFKRCRRKWWFVFFRRFGPKEPMATGARSIGNRLHAALAAHYRPAELRADPHAVLEAGIAADLERFPDQTHEIIQEADLCRAMLEGYFEWIAETGADQGLKIIGDEQVLEVPIDVDGAQIVLRARLDVRAWREQDNVTLFIDHKTVGNLTEPLRTLHMDEQMLMYHLLELLVLRANGADETTRTEGGLYNMLRKVKRTERAKPPFYNRVEVRHNIHELRGMYLRLHGEIREILRLTQELSAGADHRWVAYPSPRATCSWDCDFFPVCPMFDDGSNAEGLLEQLYEPVDPYQRYVDDKVTE